MLHVRHNRPAERVLYSHRAIVLHSFSQGLVDSLGVGERDVLLPIVPMFHVNAWGLPFTGVMFGAGLVFPGPSLDGASVLDLIVRERVTTVTAGVPTVWLGMLQELDCQPGSTTTSVRAPSRSAGAPRPRRSLPRISSATTFVSCTRGG